MIRYSCPTCRERLEVADEKAGHAYACPLCGQSSLVPGERPDTAAPALAPEDQLAQAQARRAERDRRVLIETTVVDQPLPPAPKQLTVGQIALGVALGIILVPFLITAVVMLFGLLAALSLGG